MSDVDAIRETLSRLLREATSCGILLERESSTRSEIKRASDKMHATRDALLAIVDAQTVRVKELEADHKRMEWFEANRPHVSYHWRGDEPLFDVMPNRVVLGGSDALDNALGRTWDADLPELLLMPRTLRSAIDYAMITPTPEASHVE